MKPLFLTLLFSACLWRPATAQSFPETMNKIGASQNYQRALTLEEAGDYEKALKELTDAIKMDPAPVKYHLELGACYYHLNQYSKAVEILEKHKNSSEAIDAVYQVLGNSYALLDQPGRAMDTYREGLRRFPNSGTLHEEIGNSYALEKDNAKALEWYEKGILAEPSFATNYLYAGALYLKSDEKEWGLIYGELYLILARNGADSETLEQERLLLSKALYDTYKSQIVIKSPTDCKVSFNTSPKSAFTRLFDPLMAQAAIGQQTVNPGSIAAIRSKFIRLYFEKGYDKQHPNMLFSFLKDLADKGLDKTYTHWLLAAGDVNSFTNWKAGNEQAWSKFADYMQNMTFIISRNHKYARSQYQ